MESEINMDEKTISLGEFLKRLTARIQQNDKLHMPFKDEKPWHMLFYALKKDSSPGKPAFFNDLQFDWDGPYPVCQELTDYIHALHFTGCMSAGNPSYDEIDLNGGLAKKWGATRIEGQLPDFFEHAMRAVEGQFKTQA
jgi:hypothetical protein